VSLAYKAAVGFTVKAITRFLLLEQHPNVRLYVTPIQIDPEHPALPISHPISYSIYLAKRQGPFATLGVAEDTSGLNELVIGEDAFLRQSQDIHEEREKMFFDALSKTRRGALVCVFDITDRVQHMFFRFHKDDHWGASASDERYAHVLRDLYVQMDGLLGRVMKEINDQTVLMVLSDHGFKPFRRAVELNRWLQQNGYLAENPLAKTPDLLQRVDWSKTQAYAVGFGGIYLNLAGREARGIVQKEDAARLKREQEPTAVKSMLAGLSMAVTPEAQTALAEFSRTTQESSFRRLAEPLIRLPSKKDLPGKAEGTREQLFVFLNDLVARRTDNPVYSFESFKKGAPHLVRKEDLPKIRELRRNHASRVSDEAIEELTYLTTLMKVALASEE
jgi:hypothetical protein